MVLPYDDAPERRRKGPKEQAQPATERLRSGKHDIHPQYAGFLQPDTPSGQFRPDWQNMPATDRHHPLPGSANRGAAAPPTFWQSVMGTVNRWGGNVSKWFNAEQFDQNNVLTKVGLGNWARVGTAAVAAGALTAAYYAWKKQQEKEEKRAGGLQPSNASYIPEFSSEMLMEMERSEMITQMLDEADDESDIKEKGGLEQAANKMVVSIQKDSSRAIKLLQKAFADKRFDEAPDDLKQQMQAVAQMLATQPAIVK